MVVPVSCANAIRRVMRDGLPTICPHPVETSKDGRRCGDHVGFAPFREIRSAGGRLMGWQCQRGHVLGKVEQWAAKWPTIRVGQILEFVSLPIDGGPAHQVEVIEIKKQDGKPLRIRLQPLNFQRGEGFKDKKPGSRWEDRVRKDWRLLRKAPKETAEKKEA